MSSTRETKKRIRSAKNIAQITKAMEVVSATKMRRSQEFALRARPYAVASLEILKNLLSRTPVIPPLLSSRLVKNSLLLVVTSDKGLAGAFNGNVIKKAEAWISAKQKTNSYFTLITIGKKARDYFQRRNVPITKSYISHGDYTALQDTLPIADEIIQGFINKKWDNVETIYTNFRTTLLQETMHKKILPVSPAGIEETVRGILPEHGKYADIANHQGHVHYSYEYKFEPSPAEILTELVPQLIRMHIHHIILESNASEHSARMIAMKNASENAGELITDLTLVYNKARQAGITRELTEITAGTEALEN